MTKKDILFLLSGGTSNKDVSKSIGGRPSKTTIFNGANNLFPDASTKDAISGITDYRCIYVFNSSTTEKVKNAGLFVVKKPIGATIDIGFLSTNEVQIITVPGSPVGGSFQLQYTENTIKRRTSTTRTINWVPNAAFMAQRISALINSLGNLTGVTCVGQQSSMSYDFIVTFAGTAAGRSQELLGVVNDEGLNVSITRTVSGSPINVVAPTVGTDNNPPNNVSFTTTSHGNKTGDPGPLVVGDLLPGDFFSVWIRRTIKPRTNPTEPDTFSLNFIGEPKPLKDIKHVKD